MEIFLDSDVLIDFLNLRSPFEKDIIALFVFLDKAEYKIYTSVQSVVNIHYVIGREFGRIVADDRIAKLLQSVKALSIHESTLKAAQKSGFSDFEDAIQFNCALENKMEYIVTRNIKDYKKSTIPVRRPLELLKILQK